MVKNFRIKIFADGADLASIKKLNLKKYISGFTTNPTLMKKAGIKVKKIKPMKRGMTRAIYGAFYTVKAASGNDILPVYVYKTGKIELGVSSAGFWPGKYGDMSRVVNQLKDFKRTDLDNKD